MRRLWLALGLALLSAGCVTDWFAAPELPPPRPRPVYALAPRVAAPPAREPALAEAQRGPTAAEAEDYSCAGGAVLRIAYAADRSTLSAIYNGGRALRLARADEAGLLAYRGEGAVFRRSGPRAAWSQPGGERVVQVEDGDTLGDIALRVYGRRERAYDIAQANADQISDPNLIYPGQVLRLPDAAGGEQRICRRVASVQAVRLEGGR